MKQLKWYHRVMKLPKRVYLVAAVLLFMGGAGTALALKPAPAESKRVSVEQVAAVQPTQETIPAQSPEQTAAATSTPTSDPTQVPAETVQSILDAQGWTDTQKNQCVSVILAEKPGYFKDVETTKRTIKVLPSPCYLIHQGESAADGSIIVSPTVDKMKWYDSVDRLLGNPPPNQ